MNVLNIGCGPVEHGNYPGIEIACSDKRAHPGADGADMENLPYADNSFDLVVCINALDHTQDPMSALSEFIRVSKKWVYIDCALIQKTTSGRNHFWDMLETGTMTDGETSFNVKDWGYEIEFVDNKMERRYNHVICRYTK